MPVSEPRRHSRAGTLAALLVLLASIGASVVRLGSLPRLGPFLDPAHGAWSAARQTRSDDDGARIPGLSAPVAIRFDDRRVPHIVAANELDAVRALGYAVARDRLFQLELQWRAGAGRLTELVGSAALGMDRDTRRLGLPMAAASRLASLADTSGERRLLDAFAGGANAWIDALDSRAIPFEYHLLGRQPARWEPVNSLHLLGRMGWTLALSNLERVREAAAQLVGPEAADALYPRNSPIQEPLKPNGLQAPRFDPVRFPPPRRSSSGARAAGGSLLARPDGAAHDALGSNNWAVAPRRTAGGHALLAGDPHLELTLPSIWYEAHLVVPDSLDVYGVTIPGAPAIIIGFNRDLAWTFTNTESDVLDRYLEVVDAAAAPSRYRLDGEWRDLRVVVERYRDPGGVTIATDTIRFTHRGPMLRDPAGRWTSIRWTVLEGNDGLMALSRGARARTAEEWQRQLLGFRAPPQNMLVADRQGTIAIRSTGRFPIRPAGRGDLLQRGDTTASDWLGDWSAAELPQAVNPAQGYLASANQQPLDPRHDGRYLGANWYSPWRAMRINALLRGDSSITPDDMRRFQTDPGSASADLFVPAFLAAANRGAGDSGAHRAAQLLAEWDRRYTGENTRAVLFEAALGELAELLWDELRPADPALPRPPYPAGAIIAALLVDSTSIWWDRAETTDRVEQRDDILAAALVAGLDEVTRKYGEPDRGGWRWDRIRHARINHLLYLGSLSALEVPVQGGQSTLNPSSGDGSFGPS
ncbi:MAG: penicillin acylase family protein, partial [Gemmatimonadota bacterium]|nr:penicillin acylase family protein [Gemmatimonadota bacterium]